MKTAYVLATMVAVATVAAAAATSVPVSHVWDPSTTVQQANPACDPSYQCGFTYHGAGECDAGCATFDLSPLCQIEGYMGTDNEAHTYNFNICANTSSVCLPATYTTQYVFLFNAVTGVAVISWGAPPSCNTANPACTLRGDPTCCTKDCEILGAGKPEWSVIDPKNPKTGGIRGVWTGYVANDSNPFWCTFNPKTGEQYPRRVIMNFACDPSTEFKLVSIVQNSTNDCTYTINMATQYGCAQS